VKNRNRAPVEAKVLSPREGDSFLQGTEVQFKGSARDPDGDALTYTWLEGTSTLGTGANLTAVLPVGAHSILLEVSDGELRARSQAIGLTVKANQRPVVSLDPSGTVTVQKNKPVELHVNVTDAENDPITVSWLENGNVLGNGSTFSTSGLAVGTHTLTVSVTDGKGPAVNNTLTVIIRKPPAPVPRQDMTPFRLLAIVIVIIAVVAVAALLVMRRRKKATLSAAPPPAEPAPVPETPMTPPPPQA